MNDPHVGDRLGEQEAEGIGRFSATVLEFGADGSILTWPDSAAEIFGFDSAEALGRPPDRVPIIDPEVRAASQTTIERGGLVELELFLRRNGGESFPARVRAQRTDGGAIVMINDLSELAGNQPVAIRPRSYGALADLGRAAVSGGDGDLLEQATRAIVDSLGIWGAAVLNITESGDLLQVACAGELARFEPIRIAPGAPELGYLMPGEQPLVAIGIDAAGLAPDSALGERGVRSTISVRIGSVEEPLGLLVAMSRQSSELRPDDLDFVQSIANLIDADVTRRRAGLLEDRFRQLSQLEALGQLSGGIAHDFNNLLSVILNVAAFGRSEAGPESPLTASFDEIASAAERAAELTQQLLIFSRPDVVETSYFSVGEEVENLSEPLARSLGELIDLRIDVEPDLPAIEIGPGQLQRIVLNLAVNSRDAMPTGGTLEISAREVGDELEREIELRVCDSGEGMDAETVSKAWEPFFTTKPVGRGTGLGLPTVFGIVSEAGGTIEIDSEPGRGTVIAARFPVSRTEPDPPAAEEGPEEDGTVDLSGRRVLLVEDDEMVRRLAVRVLETAGIETLVADGPQHALELVTSRGEVVDAMLTDVVMPGMTGVQLAEQLRAQAPEIAVVLMSGYSGESLAEHTSGASGLAFVEKPFTPEGLTAGIAQAISNVGRQPARWSRGLF